MRIIAESLAHLGQPNSITPVAKATGTVGEGWAPFASQAGVRIKGTNGSGQSLTFRRVGTNEVDVAATLETALSGDDNDVVFTAVTAGHYGNDVTVAFTATATPSEALAVAVTGVDIVVTLENDAGVSQVETATAVGTIVAGVSQVETATAVGTISTSGDATVTVTADGMTGSPKAITVAVVENDTAADWATKVRAALNLDADVTELFTVGGTGADITLTTTVPIANDATLNIALADDDSVGITEDATSTDTTAGVAPGTGDATVTVTGSGITGSPVAVTVAVAGGDTAAAWAAKVRDALELDAEITALYTVGGTGASITLTRTVAAANDATLNIALADDDSVGITEAATSANTTAGVAPAIVTTADDIIEAIEADEDAAAIVTVALADENDGTGVVTALSEDALTGGVDSTVPVLVIANAGAVDLPCVANANEWEFRRTDSSDTPVTLNALIHAVI